MNLQFLKKFSRYILIGLSVIALVAAGQQMVSSDALRNGGHAVLAEEDNCGSNPNQLGCPEPGVDLGEIPNVPVQPAPAPAAPAAPQCTEVRQYNECIACNTSRRISQDSCGSFNTIVASQNDPGCASWCPAAPPPAAPTVCTPGSFRRDCTGQRAGCAANAGETKIFQCKADGSGFEEKQSECTTACVVPSAPTPPAPAAPPAPPAPPASVCTISANPNPCTIPVGSTVCASMISWNTNTDVDIKLAETGQLFAQSGSGSNSQNATWITQSGTTFNCINRANGNILNNVRVTGTPPAVAQPPAPPVPPAPPAVPNLQCPAGTNFQRIEGNTIFCQRIINTNTQTNTNTNTITNNNTATAQGGSTGSITITAPAPQVVFATTGNVGVGTTAIQVLGVTTLPKTGLPALAWAVLAFIPAGFGMRKFRGVKKTLEDDPTYIWEDRKFKAGS